MTDRPRGNGYNVVEFPDIETMADLNPDRVLWNNIGEFDSFIIVGTDKQGDIRVCITMSNTSEILGLLEKGKYVLLQGTMG